MSSHDVVVVGAGHNGLVAACYLARAGLDVLVVEAEPAAGGMTTTQELIPGAPGHLVSPCAVDVVFMRATDIPAELGLSRFGYRELDVDPTYCYLHPDGVSLPFWRDAEQTAAEIRRFSAADSAAYLDLARALHALTEIATPLMLTNPARPGLPSLLRAASKSLRHRTHLRELLSVTSGSALQAIDGRFRHPVVRDAIATLCANTVGPITGDGSGLALLSLAFLHRWGAGRPIGGTQTLIDALLAVLRAEGGRVRLGVPVAEILVSGGRARGVRLAGGEEVHATYGVLSSCDPRTTLGTLLPAGTLDERTRAAVDHIPGGAAGIVSFKVDLATAGPVTLPRHRRADGLDLRHPTLLMGGFDGIAGSCALAGAGRLPDDVQLLLAIPTALDRSQAPADHDVLYIYCPLVPLRPDKPWADQRDEFADSMVATAADYLDGITGNEIDRFVESPEDMSRRLRTAPGAPVFHVDFGLLRSGPMRPAFGLGGYRTPVEGLYLGGAGSHPGPGIVGVPGKLAAGEIIRDRRRG